MIDRSLNYGRPAIREFLKSIPPYKILLDIGAGTGVDLKIAKEVRSEAVFHGIECHKPYADDLKKYGWSIHHIDIERQAFPFGIQELDVIMANQVLEHVKEIFWIFHEMSRCLKVGGHLVLGVPNLASLHNRLLLPFGKQPTSIQVFSAHVRGYTKPGLLRFLSEVCPGQFELVAFRGANFYPLPPFLAVPMARLFPTLAWGAFFLIKKVRPYNSEFLKYASPGRLETNYYLGPSR